MKYCTNIQVPINHTHLTLHFSPLTVKGLHDRKAKTTSGKPASLSRCGIVVPMNES